MHGQHIKVTVNLGTVPAEPRATQLRWQQQGEGVARSVGEDSGASLATAGSLEQGRPAAHRA